MQGRTTSSIGGAVARIIFEVRALFATHAQMAQREMRQNLRSVQAGLILMAGAALFALVSLHALGVVAVLALADLGLGLGTAALVVLAAFVLLTVILGFLGFRCLSASSVMPNRTIESLKSDISILEEAQHDRQHHV